MDDGFNIMIVGCGMVGSSLAALVAANGYRVYVCENDETAFDGGERRIRKIYEQVKQHGHMNDAQIEVSMARCTLLHTAQETTEPMTAAFECVGEVLPLKQSVYDMLLTSHPELKAIASATSAIMPNMLAQGAKAPEKILIAHPFNPPHLVKLFEIVPHEKTEPAAVALVNGLLLHCGRKPVAMQKAAPGFIVNRMQHALLREAFYMVEQGYASFREIDETLKYSIMPRYSSVGLFENQDAVGLDLVKNIESYLLPHLCRAVEPLGILQERVAERTLGMKTGSGIYEWDEERKQGFFEGTAQPYWSSFDWPNLK